ncbi:putative outer membrane starch-binding protein [Anseongella ginsenosidimutans]|uniref:Putative outer membrane starch-binding protein n=1 Tax=Anseongella ginsenosidimutans TaxID=496056 RepID=A0A4R3KRP5_9SPHI|nr:RagB/SusD family nutrient uptake outer membrane protein [Anseongella ginsenosidimutans]QEC53078.1 RagB/SusD family nutrient uptake outer membrane protein [Anseongella ginsenosidimutans]TCS87694.1 putative outer membrane starch-binding protein [Anseongella ginsenosidimutans]
MKIFKKILLLSWVVAFTPSCNEYLDVVPDNTLKLENLFNLKEDAWNALAKVYSYLPADDQTHVTTWTLGDEWIGRLDLNDVTGNLRAIRIMRGLQSANSPQLGVWSGTQGGKPLYEALRQTDVFLANIDKVRDMTDQEKKDWKAQVTFLKGYYAFLLVQRYGPIVLPTEMVTPEATSEQLFLPRSKVEDCFNFIITLMNEAIPNLTERATENELGQVDQVAAKAIKARVLFFRASPFFNGNQEYFGDFFDTDGQPFFPLDYDKEKWKAAIDALNDAIATAEGNGLGLYHYDKEPFIYDREAFNSNRENMETLYDLRMLVCDPWNREVVWGNSNINYYGQGELAHSSNIRLPEGYGDGVVNNAGFSWQWMGATYRMAERYYTENGLPITEDLTFNMNTRHEIITTPGELDAEYDELRGIMQPGAETIRLYMNREPRFYANLGITGGYWRAHTVRINTMMYASSDGGFNSSQHSTDFLATGIGVQKFVHPESQSGAWQRTIKYPYPIIRMADLYLMKAEALNEYNDVPTQEVYDLVNLVRERAGIPDVEDVWSDATIAKTVNKHKTKEGMRDIILQERSIELAFEGSHFWDMLRHKRATSEFSTPIWGWTHTGTTGESFFILEVKQPRRFTITDCLWPIDLNELNTNGKLIQNPGW